MDKNIIETIDNCMKRIWCYDIKDDYNKCKLLQEDTMKNSMYYYLRCRLGEEFLDANNLRIFTEFHDGLFKGTGFRADLAIVQTKHIHIDNIEGYIGDKENIESIIAVIELKYKGNVSAAEEAIYKDFDKINEYMKILPEDTKYYLGIIHEKYWSKEERCWADPAGYKYPKGKVTELTASYDENDEMMFEVFEL